jgi:hypothetical protein
MAVKVVSKSRPGGGSFDSRLLRREVEIGRRIRDVPHSLLLPVVDAGETPEALLLVMERGERCLSDLVGKVPEGQVVPILQDLATGLGQLHSAGVIHRDLKPRNVLWHADHWKLADFGIARDAEIGTQDPTFGCCGSAPYMAPELWQRKSPTVKTDLYALGCLAFELLSGVPPYSGDDTTLRDAHLTTPVPVAPCANVTLRNLVIRLLGKDPGERPQDARAVSDRLARCSLVWSPLQKDIARELESHAKERALQAAAEGQRRAELEAHREKKQQAEQDLRELVHDALEQLQQVAPDIGLREPPGRLIFESPDAAVQLDLWNDVPTPPLVAGDTMILAGAVILSNRRRPEGLLSANVVYEAIGDRLGWQLYQFQAALQRQYHFGPRVGFHGLAKHDFLDQQQRDYMLHPPTFHAWQLVVRELAVDDLVRLFGAALRLSSPNSRTGD